MWGIVHGEREATSTRERICWNGPWRWQRAGPVNGSVPERRWGYCKVPGAWSGITDCMQNDSQSVLSPPEWRNVRLGGPSAAWYARR